MGQKVNPFGFRLGILYKASSIWFAPKRDYQKFVLQDIKLKKFIFHRLALAGIVSVGVERSINTIHVIIEAARPGVVIGRGGANLEMLKKEVEAFLKNIGVSNTVKLALDVKEVKNPDLSAKLVGERISEQLIKRYPHRRAISQAHERVMAAESKFKSPVGSVAPKLAVRKNMRLGVFPPKLFVPISTMPKSNP